MDWMIPWFLVDRPFLGAQVAGLDWSFWNVVGWTGNAVFSARFFVQWWATEKHKQVVVPNVFWWLSLIGSLCLLAYGLSRRDGIFVFAYLLNWIPYVRNLVISSRAARTRMDCPGCETRCPPRAKYCPECGVRLEP
jgi:lipid-A-disaccharide synthase-like uncharacterized protein